MDNENYDNEEEGLEESTSGGEEIQGVSSRPKQKRGLNGMISKGTSRVVRGFLEGMKQVILLAARHPIVLVAIIIIIIFILIWIVLGKETGKEVTNNIDKTIGNLEGIDPEALDLYKKKRSLMLLKVSEVNKLYDSFISDEDITGEVKRSMKAVIGLNEVENKKVTTTTPSGDSTVGETLHDITCSDTGNVSEEELIQISKVVQSACGLDKSYEEYLPMASLIVNRLKLKICAIKKNNQLPGIIDDATQFPSITNNTFNRADTSKDSMAYKAVLNAFNGEDPTGGATFFQKAGSGDLGTKNYEKIYSAKSVSSDKNNYYTYWKKKGQKDIKAGAYKGFKCETMGNYIPYIQNDDRWGAIRCFDNDMSSQGCAPTSVAVILSYLNLVIPSYDGATSVNIATGGEYKSPKDNVMQPVEVAKIIYDNPQYYVPGTGTDWSFFPYVFKDLCGLEGVQVGTAREALTYLQKGYVGVASCAPGLFTSGGHIISILGEKDGKILVHNVNSSNNDGYYAPSDLESGAPGNIRQFWLYKKPSK